MLVEWLRFDYNEDSSANVPPALSSGLKGSIYNQLDRCDEEIGLREAYLPFVDVFRIPRFVLLVCARHLDDWRGRVVWLNQTFELENSLGGGCRQNKKARVTSRLEPPKLRLGCHPSFIDRAQTGRGLPITEAWPISSRLKRLTARIRY